jgi:nucleolar protein 4
LLTEGKIKSNSEMYQKLSATEIAMREASAKQRKSLVEKNPSLYLSLTRLSVRNIPKFVASKDLKALAKDAVVGFATEVKGGLRQKLSPEELARGGEDTKIAERERRAKGKGVVKQAKVIFETKEGSKIKQVNGAGRSRGYGFIEYYTHRSALMGLRWLNGREIEHKSLPSFKEGVTGGTDRKRRLIVEFALENANVVKRRRDREHTARDRAVEEERPTDEINQATSNSKPLGKNQNSSRRSKVPSKGPPKRHNMSQSQANAENESAENQHRDRADQKQLALAKRQRIIAKKRMARRARKMA